jgi:hypothetical protein
MQSFIKKIELSSINKLHAIIVLMSMLLAAQMQYIQHGWINPDSVHYFESARLFAAGQWKEAVQVWNWPLYPVLIAAVHKITSLGIQTSAQILNVLFFGLATFSFIQIIRLADGRQLTMAAGALILFSSQYIVGDVLEMLMRDEGFWAFYLTGLVFFIRFYQHLRLRDALLWQLCAITATLFRIEAITYLVLLPSLFLFSFNFSFKERMRCFLIAHALNIFLALCLILAIALHGDLSMKNFGRLQEVFTLNLFDELTRELFSKAAIMSNEVLGSYLEEFAVQGLLLTFLYVIFVKSISTAGLVNVVMAIFTVRNRTSFVESKAYSALSYAALISLANMALIITKVFVLSSRYVIGLAFIVMIFASFQFAKILMSYAHQPEKSSKSKWLAIALVIFMLLGLVKNILPKSDGYNYMQDAVAWIKTNNQESKPVFTDESRITYYMGAPYTRRGSDNWKVVTKAINNRKILNYEYLLISHSVNHPEREKLITEQLPQFKEVKRFNSVKSKKSIVIYQKQNNQ